MKKYLISLIVLVFLAETSCQEKIDFEKEKEAIKAVIEEESNAYFDKDLSRVSETWVQEPSSIKLFIGEEVNKIIGWNKINAHDKEELEADRSDLENVTRESSNYQIQVYNKSAWALFDKKFEGKDKGKKFEMKQTRIYVLEKVDGKWKIALQSMYTIPSEKAGSSQEESEPEEAE